MIELIIKDFILLFKNIINADYILINPTLNIYLYDLNQQTIDINFFLNCSNKHLNNFLFNEIVNKNIIKKLKKEFRKILKRIVLSNINFDIKLKPLYSENLIDLNLLISFHKKDRYILFIDNFLEKYFIENLLYDTCLNFHIIKIHNQSYEIVINKYFYIFDLVLKNKNHNKILVRVNDSDIEEIVFDFPYNNLNLNVELFNRELLKTAILSCKDIFKIFLLCEDNINDKELEIIENNIYNLKLLSFII